MGMCVGVILSLSINYRTAFILLSADTFSAFILLAFYFRFVSLFKDFLLLPNQTRLLLLVCG